MFKDANKFTEKEIQYGIMYSLMQIEGHIRELVLSLTPVEYGEEVDNDINSDN